LLANEMLKDNKLLKEKAINFGSGKPISILNLVKKLIKYFEKNNNFYIIKDNATNEIKDQYSGYKKAKKYLNWSPKIKLDEGLSNCIKWYKTNYY